MDVFDEEKKGFDVSAVTFKPAKLPREKKRKLRDLVVALAGAFRHEERLRWQAEEDRDAAQAEVAGLKMLAEDANSDRRQADGRANMAEAELRDVRAMLDKANQRLRDLGGSPVSEMILPARTEP